MGYVMARYKFWGHFQHTLDSKNRVAIPAKFRQQIPDGKVVVTEFFEECLSVFPAAEWEKFVESELEGLSPIESRRNRMVTRMMHGSATDVEIDRQGRISLQAYLLESAGISKEVVFKGVNDRFEIWDRNQWEAYRSAYKQRDGSEE